MTSDEPDWPRFDPYGADAWCQARDLARASGGDLTPLIDMHPADRARRWADMVNSNVPDERTQAMAEITQAAAEAAPKVVLLKAASHVVPLPDAPWKALTESDAVQVLHGRRNGSVIVVRESGTCSGRYYAIVGGHHLSYRGHPVTFGNLNDAKRAAEAATDHPSHPQPEWNE